jgi:predicted transcriptional regulator
MPRKPSSNLTASELRLMEVLWRKGNATVADIAAALPKQLGLAYNTVLTTMRILEAKGYARHDQRKQGRAFVYRPIMTRKQASRSAVHQLLDRFFGASAEALVLNLIEEKDLNRQERDRIRSLLEEEES